MIKTLTKHGNSYALVIDKPILELLRVSPEPQFEMWKTDHEHHCLQDNPSVNGNW